MVFIRMLENPRKCMQRIGFLKWLVQASSRTATSNISTLGECLITALSTKVSIRINPDLVKYVKTALRSRVHRGVYGKIRELEDGMTVQSLSLELQDGYLSASELPSRRGRLAKDEKQEYPSFALGLGLIRKGTYSLLVRGRSFLSLTPENEIAAFKEYDPESNPLRLSSQQKLLLAHCLIESDGHLLRGLYSSLMSQNGTFSDLEASGLLPGIFETILKKSKSRVRSGDDLKRIQRIEGTIKKLKEALRKPSIGGGGIRLETIAPRLEPFVDLGLLHKEDPFAYRYSTNTATDKFFRPLIESTSVDEYLSNRFFDAANEAMDLKGKKRADKTVVLPAIQRSYDTIKSPLGYAPIREVSLLAGIETLVDNGTYFELSESLEVLKTLQKENPNLVTFSVDRLGKLANVKFNDRIALAEAEDV